MLKMQYIFTVGSSIAVGRTIVENIIIPSINTANYITTH